MTLVLVKGWKWWEEHVAYDLINGTTWSWTPKSSTLSPPDSLSWLRVTETNQSRHQYGRRSKRIRRYTEILTSAEKNIDASIWKGVHANMLDIALTLWLGMSNILTSLRSCFIARFQIWYFFCTNTFLKISNFLFLIFQMVYWVSISKSLFYIFISDIMLS